MLLYTPSKCQFASSIKLFHNIKRASKSIDLNVFYWSKERKDQLRSNSSKILGCASHVHISTGIPLMKASAAYTSHVLWLDYLNMMSFFFVLSCHIMIHTTSACKAYILFLVVPHVLPSCAFSCRIIDFHICLLPLCLSYVVF